MNRIYRTLWSAATQSWQAVPETAKSAGKKSVKSSSAGVVASFALSWVLTGGAYAQAPPAINQLPTGGTVVRGTATINQTATAQAAAMTVNQSSQRAVVNWNTFNLGSAASINFVQPNAQAVTLNRVNDNNPSQIFGRISSNGQVFLTNPNGVYFSPTSSVDVGAITATTHSISDDNFMSGKYVFERNGATGKVVNEGNITAALGGYVALLAPEVQNSGVVVARAGTVVMAAGEMITLQLDDAGSLAKLTTTPSTMAALIENKHAVQAPDGQIILSAVALNKLQAGVIKNSGNLEANSLVSKGGKIFLEGDDIVMDRNSKIEAKGRTGGGTVLVGGDWQGSGEMRQATKVTMEAGASIDASATDNGDGGKVVLWTDVHNADSVTQVKGALYARGGQLGGHGGQIETSGHKLEASDATGDASAPHGNGGEWLFDPYNITITTATAGGAFDSSTPLSTWTSTANASTILNTAIESKLNAGTNVKITTAAAGGAEVGNLAVNATITSTNANSSLTLIADGDISINQDINLASAAGKTFTANAKNNIYLGTAASKSITTNGGDILLLSNSAASTNIAGGAAIKLWAGSNLTSNGGNITLAGGTSNAITYAQGGTASNPVGVLLAGTNTLSSAGGDIVIKGAGAALAAGAMSGVELDTGVTLNSGSGKINLVGKNNSIALGVGATAYGVYTTGTTTLTSLSTDASAISIQGIEGAAPAGDNSAGISLTGSTLNTTAGGITLKSDRMFWGSNTWNAASLTVSANTAGSTNSVSMPSTVAWNAASSSFTFNGAISKSNAARTTLTVSANNDLVINGSLTATNSALNVSLTANNNLSLTSTSSITTNHGNFYVGSVAANGIDTVTASGQNFSMGSGSFINAGTGMVNISVNGNIQLPNQTGYANRYALTNLTGATYFNNGTLYNGAKKLILSASSGNITTLNTNASTPDIVTSVDTTLTARNIGTDGSISNGSFVATALKFSGPADPYGLLIDSVNNRNTFVNTGRTLTVNNSVGSSFIDEIQVQNFSTIAVNLNGQHNQTQAISIMGDTSGTGTGHIRLNTSNTGLLALAANDINTSGVAAASNVLDPVVFPTSVSIYNPTIEFASGSVKTGAPQNYYYMGTGSYFKSTYGMVPYAASFTAAGAELTAQTVADGVAEIQSSQLNLTANSLGASTKPIEIIACISGGAGCNSGFINTLDLSNTAGSTFVRITDNSFNNVTLRNTNTVGEHHLWWSGGDHVDFTSDANVTYNIASIGNDANSSAGYEASPPTGINTSRLSSSLHLIAYSGQVAFDSNSVNTNLGTFTVDANGTGAASASGKVQVGDLIYGTHTKDGNQEIKALAVTLNSTTTTSPANIVDVETKGPDGVLPVTIPALTLSNYSGGNIDFKELTPGFYKTINVVMSGPQKSGQTVDVTLTSPSGAGSADGVHLVDGASQLLLDSTKVKLSEYNRNFSLAATGRNVQIDSNSLGTGFYNISAQNITLNGDVLTNGGGISLFGSNGIQLTKSIRIDSNADDTSNSTSTGVPGTIQIAGGNLTVTGSGQNLVVDSSSSTTTGGFSGYTINSAVSSGYRLNNLTIDTGGVGNDDGYLQLSGAHVLNNAFIANGRTSIVGAVSITSATGGDVKFTGHSMNAAASIYSLSIDTSQAAGNANGGNVDLYNTVNHLTYTGGGLTVKTTGSGTGTSGTIELPSMSMGAYIAPTAVSAQGGVINLHGDITTLRGGVSLTGDVRLLQNTTINTWQLDTTSTSSTAGAVTIGGVGVSSQAGGAARTLTINTNTNTLSLDANPSTPTVDSWTQNGGAVSVIAANGSGVPLSSLTVNASASGTTNIGTGGNITLNGVTTSGAQTYSGYGITVASAVESTAGDIQMTAANNSSLNASLTAGTITLTQATGKTWSGNGNLIASKLLLNGTGGGFTLNTATGNQVGLLAASNGAGNLSFLNSTAFTVGTINGVAGITTSGTLNLASATGDITINNHITSTNTTASAVVINAGKDKNYRDSTGGNVVLGAGIRVYLDNTTPGSLAAAKIYSGSVSETSLTTMIGSGSGRFRYDSDEVTTNYTNALGTGLYAIYRERPTLSSIAANTTKVYDGLTYAGHTTVSYTGYANGDVSPYVYNYGASNTINVGTYRIVVNGLISGLGYAVTPSDFDLTVTPRPLVISATAASKIYDGTTAATVTLYSNAVATDVAGLTLLKTSATFSNADYGIGKTVTVSGLSFTGSAQLLANYTMTGAPSSATTTSNITQKTLTMSGLGSSNKIYDGTTAATVIGTAALTGFEAVGTGTSGDGKAYTGDDVSITGTAIGTFNSKDVATATIVTFTGLSLTGTKANNYTFNIQSPIAQSITRKALSMSGLTSSNKIYDGTTTATVAGTAALAAFEAAGSGNTADGKAYTNDVVSITGTATGTFNSKDVSAANSVSFAGLSLAGASANNYSLTIQSAVSQTITPKALNMSGLNSSNKVYDGTTTATVTGAPALAAFEAAGTGNTGDGKAYTGDTVSITGTAVGTFNSKDVSTATSVSFSGLSLTGTEATNYSLTMQPAVAKVITPKALTMSGLTSADKIYDGTTSAAVTGAAALASTEAAGTGNTADGKPYASDNVSITGTAVGTFNSKDVRTANAVSFSGLTLTGTQANNYSLTIQPAVAQVITPKSLSMSGLMSADKAYDGNTTAVVTGTATLAAAEAAGTGNTADGKPYTGDVVGITGTATGTFNSKDVNTANSVTFSNLTLTLTGNEASNYSPTIQAPVTQHITPKTVQLSATKVYDGTTDLTGAVSITTGVGSEVLNYTNATASDAHVATVNKHIASITLANASGAGVGLASNYQLPALDAAHAAVTITPLTLTPTLTNIGVTKVYDGTTTGPTGLSPTYAITGFINGDSDANLTHTNTNYNSANVSTANSLTVSGVSIASITGVHQSASSDYVLNSNALNVAASITPKTVQLSAAKTYDGTTSLTGAVTINTGIGNETLSYTNATANDTHVVTANKYITAITLGDGSGLATNYQLPALNPANAPVQITPATLTPTLSNTGTTKIYDGTTDGPGGFTPTYTLSGLTAGDTSALLLYTSSSFNNANVTQANQLTVSGLSIAAIGGIHASTTTDYVLDATSKSVNATITPKPLIVKANDDAQFVTLPDRANFAGASYSGFVPHESVADLSGTLSITRTNNTVTAAGVYSNVLVPSGLSSSNYALVNQSGQYTIVPANQLLLRVANSTSTYGTATPVTVSSAQYLASDNTTIRDLTNNISNTNGVFSITDGASGSAQFGLGLNNPTLSNAGLPTVGIWDIAANNFSRNNAINFNNLVVVGAQTISPKPLTIGVSAANKVYDGTTTATPTLSTADRITGDNVSLLVGGANFTDKNVGVAKPVAVTGLGITGTDVNNYALQNVAASTTADITPKTLTASVTATDKVYDGTTIATPTMMITSGLVGNETLRVDASASFNSKNVKDAELVTVDSILLRDGNQGGLANNYSLSTGQTTIAHITPKSLTATVIAEDKNFDGKLQATALLKITDGLVGQETLVTTNEASFDNINPGQNKLVVVDQVLLKDAIDGSGGLASNYSLNAGQTTHAAIRPKMLIANLEPKLSSANGPSVSLPKVETVQTTRYVETKAPLPVESSEGIVINHFKAPTEDSIGIVAIRLPRGSTYSGKNLVIALGDEIDFSYPHDPESIRLQTIDKQPVPPWIQFDAVQKVLIISGAPKEAFPMQLILIIGDRRYLMQISESMYVS